ncbi:unnamed protein product [Effrenium voratum]|nr:unnamed protein product [Effrenium voratum]
MLLNNYSNGDPLRANTGDEESNKRNEEWGDKNPQGHRAAFCVPLIVPKDMAYNIFERQTPDISGRLVDGKRRIALGEDYKGRKVHSNRDVWVIRIEGGGEVQHAKMKGDALANVLEKRLQKLWSAGIAGRLDCMAELAERYQGRARFGDAEPLLTQIYAECQGKEPEASKSLASLAVLMHEQGKLYDAEPLLRKALTGLQRSVGDDHPDTVRCKKQFTGLLQDIGSEGKIAALERTGRTKPSRSEEDAAKEKLKAAIGRHGPGHPATFQAMQELAMVLEARGSFDEAEQLFHMSGGRPKAASQATVSASAARKAEFQEKLRALGNMHPETLKAMHLLTASLHQEGQLKEAEQMGCQALKSRREKLGDTHPYTLESMHELGAIFKAMGNIGEAEQLFREGLDSSRKVLGGTHHHTVQFNNSLATMLTAAGRAGDVPAPASFKEWLAGHHTPLNPQPNRDIPFQRGVAQGLPSSSGSALSELSPARRAELDADIERVLLGEDSDE